MNRLSASVCLALVVVVALGLFIAPTARARSLSSTITFHDATDSFAAPNPCSGAPGTVTIVANGVIHLNVNPDGTSWFTLTQTGTFTFVPDDFPADPSYAGTFTLWDGDNVNLRNFAATFILEIPHAAGSDGSTLSAHETETIAITGTGDVAVSFSNLVCG